MTKQEIRDEIRSILKDYHYNSDTENMSKDVVTALENLVGDLKNEETYTQRLNTLFPAGPCRAPAGVPGQL